MHTQKTRWFVLFGVERCKITFQSGYMKGKKT